MYVSIDIAERIKEIAKQRQVSVKQLLSDTELGRNTMSNFKTSFPQSDSIAKIADYLDCSVDYLLGRTDNLTAHKTSNNVSVGAISGNSGIVGNVVSSSVNSSPNLNEQETTLLNLFRSFDVIAQARIITCIADMQEKIQGGKKND